MANYQIFQCFKGRLEVHIKNYTICSKPNFLAKVNITTLGIKRNVLGFDGSAVITKDLKNLLGQLELFMCPKNKPCTPFSNFPLPDCCLLFSQATGFGSAIGKLFNPPIKKCPIKRGSYTFNVSLDVNAMINAAGRIQAHGKVKINFISNQNKENVLCMAMDALSRVVKD